MVIIKGHVQHLGKKLEWPEICDNCKRLGWLHEIFISNSRFLVARGLLQIEGEKYLFRWKRDAGNKCLDFIVLIILWHSTVSVIALFDLSLWFNGELVGIVKWICLRKIKGFLFAFCSLLVLLIVLVAFPRQMIHQLLVTCVAAKHTLTQSYKNHQVLIANMQYLESKAKHTKIIPQVSLRHNKKERWIFEELQRIDSDESRLPFHNCVKLLHFVFPLFKLKPTSSTNER